jgi:site-specific DNA recombinase
MNNAILYLRCSTVGQATEGVSIEMQRTRAMAWCEANGYTVSAVYADEGVSGKRAENRPQLGAALEHVCKLARQRSASAAIVVYSLSRLARSTRDALSIAERLDRAGADLVSLSERIDTTTAAGKMVFRMLAVLSEFERDLVSERTTAALALKKSKGERVGQIPFGYDVEPDGVRLVQNTREQEVLADVAAMRRAGRSWREVADTLNARGVRTKTGSAWSLHNARKVAQASPGATTYPM